MDTLHSAGGNHVRDNCYQIGNVENEGHRYTDRRWRLMCVCVYGGGDAANPSVTDVNQTENIAIYFNVLIYGEPKYVLTLAIPSTPPPKKND